MHDRKCQICGYTGNLTVMTFYGRAFLIRVFSGFCHLNIESDKYSNLFSHHFLTLYIHATTVTRLLALDIDLRSSLKRKQTRETRWNGASISLF